MLKHASRSRHIDPDRPPAAAGGLRSQVPDLVHGRPFKALGSRSTAASCSTRLVDENGPAPSAGLEVEGGHRLGSFSYHTGASQPQLTRAADGLRARERLK